MLIQRDLIRAVPPLPESMPVARLIHRDPVDPGPQCRLPAEPVDRAKHPKEDFLGQVERLFPVAEKVRRQLHDDPLVLRHQLFGRELVASRTALEALRSGGEA